MRNLAPHIFRKRVFIEGFYNVNVNATLIKEILTELCKILKMTPLTEPLIFSCTGRGSGKHHGIGGYMAWVESGVSIYTWEKYNFFTVDIYSCKDFKVEDAVNFIKDKLKSRDLEYEEFRYL